jgi:predicted DNA-binding protein
MYGKRYAMKTAAAHNFHVPLPAALYSRLRVEAERQHKPATQLVKQVVEYWLEEQEKLALHEEIARYAAEMAGTSDDLDEQLEFAGVEHLKDSVKQP